jgi:hypothetical protein
LGSFGLGLSGRRAVVVFLTDRPQLEGVELSDGSVFEAKVKPIRVRELAVTHLKQILKGRTQQKLVKFVTMRQNA